MPSRVLEHFQHSTSSWQDLLGLEVWSMTSPGDQATIYICTVFLMPEIPVSNEYGYIEIVRESAERSMRPAVDQVEALPQYATSAQVLVCCFKETFLVDTIQWGIPAAGHDSTGNAIIPSSLPLWQVCLRKFLPSPFPQ